jgi:hypothetical protein
MSKPTRSARALAARRWTALSSAILVAGALAVAALVSTSAQARAQAAPVNQTLPTISGDSVRGQALTATSGAWSNTPTTFAYRWLRCDAGGAACAEVSGATGSGYTVGDADVGKTLRVEVTAGNADGSGQATSEPTAVVTASAPPARTADPTVAGSPVEGQTLTATSGGWSGTAPIAFAYQWVRCGTDGGAADGSNCAFVPGATGSTYRLVSSDVGARMRVRVTATNAAGAQTVASNATSTVQSAAVTGAPRNTKEPSLAGTTTQGQTLTANGGTWVGAAPITYAYQWVRCGADGGRADGSNCPAIAGATTTRYVLTAADVGQRLRIRVTARNASGSVSVASNPTGQVASSAPALPPGAVKLPNGKYSIPVTSVSLPARLVIDAVAFTPNPVRTRQTTLTLRVHVVDTRGYVVRDALVFGRSTPVLTSAAGEQRTGSDGWATLAMTPRAGFPLQNGHNVQFFARARKQGDNVLAGISTRRLVQVRTAR